MEKKTDFKTGDDNNEDNFDTVRTINDASVESEELYGNEGENASSSNEKSAEFRQTAKYRDSPSFVAQHHHSIGTGLFLTDDILDLPPRYRDRVVKALESAAALNNIQLPVDPQTFLSSVHSDSDKRKDSSDALVTFASSSQNDEKYFESKRAPSRASSHESVSNNSVQKVSNFNQSHHPNSSKNFHKKGGYNSISQDSRTGIYKGPYEKHSNTNQKGPVYKGGVQNQPVLLHRSNSLHPDSQLEAPQLNVNCHPRHLPVNMLQDQGFKSVRPVPKPAVVANVSEQNQLQFQNRNSVRSINNQPSNIEYSSNQISPVDPDYIMNLKVKGILPPSDDVIISYDYRSEESSSSENRFEPRSIFNEVFPNFNPKGDSRTEKQISKSDRDSTSSVASSSQISSSFREIHDDSRINSKPFSRRSSTCSHSDESNFTLDSKSFNRNKTTKNSFEVEKKVISDNKAFHNKKAYIPVTNNGNSSSFTRNHHSSTFNKPESPSDSTSYAMTNKSVKPKNYNERELNNYSNKSNNSRNYDTRNISNEKSHNTATKALDSVIPDSGKTELYNQTYVNKRFIDDKSGSNPRYSTSSRSYKGENVSKCEVIDHCKNIASKRTDAPKDSKNFVAVDLHSSDRNREEKRSKNFNELSANEQKYNDEDWKHRHDKNQFNDASSVKSVTSLNRPNSVSNICSSNNLGTRHQRKFSKPEYEYPNSKKDYDALSKASDTSVNAPSSRRSSTSLSEFRYHERKTEPSSFKYSKSSKGPSERFSNCGRKMNSNSENFKQSKQLAYGNECLDDYALESQNKYVNDNENFSAKKFRHSNEYKSFENNRHVKSVERNKKNTKDDAESVKSDETLRSVTHSKQDQEFKRRGCVERGFFLRVEVSEESTNLQYWYNNLKNILPFQFDIERCCHFSDRLIISFEQKNDALNGNQILFREKKKMMNSPKPRLTYISALKYQLIKPCDCEHKIIPDCIRSIEENAKFSIRVINNKMNEIELSMHGDGEKTGFSSRSEVILTEREMLNTFVQCKRNFTSFKEDVISKVKVAENLKTIQKLKLSFLRECNIFKRCLPIYSRKKEILESVRYYPVSVIVAETGSGKSTQLVEYLLHSHFADHGIIICTQPRKLAAISIAQYVSGQIGSAVGKVIGYDVGMEKKRSDVTKVIYMTDYCLLKTYLRNKGLKGVSCIIIDEAHERSLYTDLLFGILKRCLPSRPDLRVIITSATINPSIFIDYFNLNPKSVIEVPGRLYPVDVVWWPSDVDLRWNYVEACVEKVYQIHTKGKEGDILIFLTSPGEAEEAINLFKHFLTKRDKKVQLICLHGKSDIQEQMQIFQTSSHAVRKIIFATNVAETAVTIPGIKYVVDSGMTKGLIFDPKKNKSVLAVTFINKSSAEQRKGRAGRTQSGVCYRMYSVKNFADNMTDNAVPDILKTNLQKALLKIFEFEIDPEKFEFIESPPKKTISNAIDSLKYLGAIDNSKLTDLGRKLAKLPLEPQLAKLVLLGVEAGIGYEIIIIAALVTEAGKLFIRNEDNKAIADEKKRMFCHPGGDLCTYLEVYKRWKEVQFSHRFDWCVANYVSSKALNAAAKTVHEIITSLQTDLSISVSKKYNNSVFKQHYERVLFDSFSENLCVSSGHPKLGYLSPCLPESFYIHPSSTLSYLGKDIPEYLIYSTLMETSRNYLFDITPISEETIKLANKSGSFDIPLNSLKSLEIPPKVMGPFGESVLIRHVLGKQGCKIKDLESKFKDFTNTRNIQIDVAVDKGLITVYIGHRHHEKIAKEINEIIGKAHDEMLREEDVIKLAETSVHFALGAGGIISDIIMPGEFRELTINGLDKRKCNEVQDLLESYGSLLSIDQTTCKQQIQICATYRKVCDALKAFSDLTKRRLYVVSPKPYLPNVSDKTLPLYMLKVSWCRCPCTGKGSVEFNTQDDLVVASGILTNSSFYLDNNYVNFFPSEFSVKELRMANLPRSANEKAVENELMKCLPNYLHIKKINVVRTLSKVTDDDLRNAKKKLEQLFSRFTPTNKLVIDVKYPKPAEYSWEASVYFECYDDGEDAFKKLEKDGAAINSYPLSVSKVLKSSFDCKKELFVAVSDQIEKILRGKKRNEFYKNFNIKHSANKVTVEFTCGTIVELVKIRQALMHLLQGETMDLIGKPKSHFLFSEGYAKRIKGIEKSTNTIINLNDIRKVITIYGLNENCKKAKEKIYSITLDSNLSSARVFNLNDSGIPSGFLKHIYMKFGYDLHGLIDTFELTVAKIGTDRNTLTLKGSKDGIKQAEKALEKICEGLYNSRSSKKKPTNAEEICPICLEPVSYDFHRLEHCGHAFCRQCLLLQVESKSIPLVCVKQYCEKFIFLEDIKHIISFGGNHLRKSFTAAALQHHVISNIGKISYCPMPDCQSIYRVTKQGSEYNCPGCKICICTHCQTAYHYGMSCDMFQNCLKDEDYSLRAWVKEKESERKHCPSCKAVIEKAGGCNHMECLNCKVHLCWLCLKVFDRESLVYEHLPYCPKNQS